MVVNSVISLYYYLAVPRAMIFVEPVVDRPLASPALVNTVVAVAMVAVLVIGVYPEVFAYFAPRATLGP
jgi:NADH:ubiquinone oxidoreductase subunit 2 (subunit N)